ncbi:MAG TPA: 3-oxoacyl-[acyl-carrier-protein] reductase [Candidatus Merdenecus merdavium]|nr:3-oxoacyl-[acyl-carrier-protein] reductase [Candidatus Merdenecus merdavium]
MLKDKIALVTGASRGIGREIALQLAKEGAFVIVNYFGSEEKAKEVVNNIVKDEGKAIAMKCNVADSNETKSMIDEILKRYGRIDILVNNAGITKDSLIMKMKEEDFNQVLDINLKGSFHTIRHCSRQMLKQKSGKIINISSVVGVMGNSGQCNYAASKAGVIGLTKSIARELGSRGIQVNAVAPGFIDTDMTEVLPESVRELAESQIPLKHFGTAKDVAETVLFLAGDKSNYITGQVIHVDGGMSM